MSESDLASYGFVNSADIQAEAYARVLLIGAMKVGKTTAILETAPGPIAVLNCDGVAATLFPAKRGAKFEELQVRNNAGWQKGVDAAIKAAKDGKVKTIVLDTVTLLADSLHREFNRTKQGFEIYAALETSLKDGLSKLLDAPAHVFVVAHMDPKGEDGSSNAGILPLIKGKATAVWVPSKISDWILFENDPMNKEPRRFLVGPQKYWNHSGRRITRSVEIKADVMQLFGELGITP